MFFFSFLDTEHFFWANLAKKVAELSKLDSQFQWRLSGASLLQNLQIDLFLEFRAELFRLAVRKKSAGLSSCFLPLHGNNLTKNFSKSFCIFCGLFFGSFTVIGQEKFLSDCQNCIHCIYKIISKKKLFWQQMKIFINFRQWAGSFRLLVDFFDGDVRTAFYVSKTTF